MQKNADGRPAPTVFAIPEDAHVALVQIGLFLRLMAHLTETGTNASLRNARLAPDAVGWCFATLSKDVDAIIGATYFSAELADADKGRVKPTRH